MLFENMLLISMFFFAVVIALLYLKAIAREKFLSGLELSDFEKKLFKKYELKNLEQEKELYKFKSSLKERLSHEERTEKK